MRIVIVYLLIALSSIGCTPTQHAIEHDRDIFLEWRRHSTDFNELLAFMTPLATRVDSISYETSIWYDVAGPHRKIRTSDWAFGDVTIAGVRGSFFIYSGKSHCWIATEHKSDIEFGKKYDRDFYSRDYTDSIRGSYTTRTPNEEEFLRLSSYIASLYGSPEISHNEHRIDLFWRGEGLELTYQPRNALKLTFREYL